MFCNLVMSSKTYLKKYSINPMWKVNFSLSWKETEIFMRRKILIWPRCSWPLTIYTPNAMRESLGSSIIMSSLQRKSTPRIKKWRRLRTRPRTRRVMRTRKTNWRKRRVIHRGSASWPSRNWRASLPTPRIIVPFWKSTKSRTQTATSWKNYDSLIFII